MMKPMICFEATKDTFSAHSLGACRRAIDLDVDRAQASKRARCLTFIVVSKASEHVERLGVVQHPRYAPKLTPKIGAVRAPFER